MVKKWDLDGKNLDFWSFQWDLPSGYVKIAIENGDL